MNRADFQRIAEMRIAEAHALMASAPPHPSGAYYLAGYAVECALKATICKRYQMHDWPERKFVLDSHTHDLKTLCRLAELAAERENEAKANVKFSEYWALVFDWEEGRRYVEIKIKTAIEFIEAISDPLVGLLPWIKNRW